MHVFSLDSSWFAQHCLKKFGIRREGFLKSRAQIKTINYASNASEVQMEALFGQNLPSSAPAQWWTQSSPGDCFQRTCGEKTILYIDSLKPHGLASDWWLHFQRLARNSMQNIWSHYQDSETPFQTITSPKIWKISLAHFKPVWCQEAASTKTPNNMFLIQHRYALVHWSFPGTVKIRTLRTRSSFSGDWLFNSPVTWSLVDRKPTITYWLQLCAVQSCPT